MLYDHWPAFQLHKNTLFYKSPSDDTRQEKGVRLRNERGQANGTRHRRPKREKGSFTNIQTRVFNYFSSLLSCSCQVFHYRLYSRTDFTIEVFANFQCKVFSISLIIASHCITNQLPFIVLRPGSNCC